MTVADLSLGSKPRTRGRPAKAVSAEFLRELDAPDLALLGSERGVHAPAVKQLRDRHHALARALAQGISESECSAITGYSSSRISILKADSSFRELVAHYREVKGSAFADFQERAAAVSIEALNIIADRLEDEPEAVTTGQALEIVKTLADRTGHAPVSRIQQTNINVDLGGRLAAARQRLETARIVASEAAKEQLPGGEAPFLLEGEFAPGEA